MVSLLRDAARQSAPVTGWHRRPVVSPPALKPSLSVSAWCYGLAAFPLLLLALVVSTGLSQEAGWDDWTTLGVRAYQEGHYAEAEKNLSAALRAAEQFGEQDPRLATSLHNLATLYRQQARYPEAQTLFERAVAVFEKTVGPDDPQLAASLSSLAWLYHQEGRFAQAEPLYRRSLSIFEKTLGTEHADVAANLNDLAEIYRAQGRTAEAEPLYRRALVILEKTLGPDDPRLALTLNNLAELYKARESYPRA